MFKLFKRLLVAFFLVLFLVHWLPMEFILLFGMVLVIVVFLLFHLGVQDFQGY